MAKSGKAVVVFHMTGCHACHDYLPRFKRVAVKYRPFVDIKQVNISHAANQDAADKYKINAAPTTVILDAKGKALEKIEGSMPAADIAAMFERASKP